MLPEIVYFSLRALVFLILNFSIYFVLLSGSEKENEESGDNENTFVTKLIQERRGQN